MGLPLLFLYSLWLLWLLHRDVKDRPAVSSSIWIVLAWAVIHGTRPLTMWLSAADLATFQANSRDEGNLSEAIANLFLIMAGLIVVWRRGARLSVVVRNNGWLCALYLFWFSSILWSDYPLITFKRLFKDLGTIVMVLVVLTESKPDEAMRAMFARLAYICVPLSILLYKYFPYWGRGYAGYKADKPTFVGVTTSKNTLGILVCVSALFILWDFLQQRTQKQDVASRGLYYSRLLVLLMCWYLLFAVNSVTSLMCAMIGSGLLIAFNTETIRKNPIRMEFIGVSAAAVFVLFDLVLNIKEALLESLGRNMTLTNRTDIWAIVELYQDNPLGGAGFDTFWSGRRLELLSENIYGVIQAHNGYLETYLNGGMFGVSLLVVVLFFAYWHIRKELMLGRYEDNMRYVILLIALIYNVSEASFNKPGIMWLATVYAIMQYQRFPARAFSERRYVLNKQPLMRTNSLAGTLSNKARGR
jgi:exopolysaccharide production protein ExoQ